MLPLQGMKPAGLRPGGQTFLPKIHIFSKHLQFLNYRDMADSAAEMGFDGVDLTVRPKGHVLPERVEEDLPLAAGMLKKAGLQPCMITTAVEGKDKTTDRKVLQTASRLDFRYYRMNWYRYSEEKSMPESIRYYRQKMKDLGQLNRELNLVGCYQNHAGTMVGASPWELWSILENADRQYMGVQYDIRHATVEGGLSWPNGFRLIRPFIKTIVVKDFRWEQRNGQWTVRNTPIGEGMVDFKTYFGLLKQYGLEVPVSLHLEYPLGGAEHGAAKLSCKPGAVFAAMKTDLEKVKDLWRRA